MNQPITPAQQEIVQRIIDLVHARDKIDQQLAQLTRPNDTVFSFTEEEPTGKPKKRGRPAKTEHAPHNPKDGARKCSGCQKQGHVITTCPKYTQKKAVTETTRNIALLSADDFDRIQELKSEGFSSVEIAQTLLQRLETINRALPFTNYTAYTASYPQPSL